MFYYQHDIEIEVGGWSSKVEAGFMEGVSHFNYGVVGQKGFFNMFIVKFDLLKQRVELKRRG